jgi:hypothetical protein
MVLQDVCRTEAEIDVQWVLDRIDYGCHDPVMIIVAMKGAMKARFGDIRFEHQVLLESMDRRG